MPISSDVDAEVEERRAIAFTLDALLAIVAIELRNQEQRQADPPKPLGTVPQQAVAAHWLGKAS